MNGVGIMVPRPQAEQPTGDNDQPFPKGAWNAAIEEPREREFPDWMGPNADGTNGYTSDDGEILGVQLGQNRPLEEQEEVGARKFFVDFIVRDGGHSIEDEDIPENAWQLLRSQRLLANLAIALGATEILVDDNDDEFVVVEDGFVDSLREGAYNGSEVSYEIIHRTWTSKDGESSGVEERVKGFQQAV